MRLILLTSLAMAAFAGNSLLCRMALMHTGIDAASFTSIRLVSGAVALALLTSFRSRRPASSGDWLSAAALFTYAAGFSFAYVTLPAAVGALLLFGAVQTTMIGYGLWQGERLRTLQVAGLAGAVGGLVGLLLPGFSAPSLEGSVLMLGAGAAWGIYSLRGQRTGAPLETTAGNFLRTVPLAAGLSLAMATGMEIDSAGVGYAVASGALASGIGYAVWYATAPAMRATTAATVQLTVPVIAAAGGVFFLDEPVTWRLALASLAILGGVGLFLSQQHRARPIS